MASKLESVIPTAILAGLIAGRWWTIPLIGLGWSLLVLFDGSCRGTCAGGAFLLGFINGAVGVGFHRALRTVLRRT
jgi:hypothetical protein